MSRDERDDTCARTGGVGSRGRIVGRRAHTRRGSVFGRIETVREAPCGALMHFNRSFCNNDRASSLHIYPVSSHMHLTSCKILTSAKRTKTLPTKTIE